MPLAFVNIPVRLYSASESQSLASHMLHKKDLSRIRFQRVAESTGKEVPAEEIVKGYEVEKNQYVILADEELREVAPEKSTGIEIQEFVNEAEISSLYFEKPYYLEPDKGAGKAFTLLREALMKTGKVKFQQRYQKRHRNCVGRACLEQIQFAFFLSPWCRDAPDMITNIIPYYALLLTD